jgi:outer membrane protein TolC
MIHTSTVSELRVLHRVLFHCLFAASCAFLASCSVGPDYVRPSAPVPAAYKEDSGWKQAEPRDDALKGPWWELFDDPQLNALEEQVDISNQNIIAAEAQFRQAQALVRAARAAYFPTFTIGASATRTGRSANLGTIVSGTGGSTASTRSTPRSSLTTSDFLLGLDMSWNWMSGARYGAPWRGARPAPRPARRTWKRSA